MFIPNTLLTLVQELFKRTPDYLLTSDQLLHYKNRSFFLKMKKYWRVFRNRNVILSLAIILGLLVGQGAQWTEPLVLPALVFVMFLSTTNISGTHFQSPRKWVSPLISGIVMNYGVLGGIILLLSHAFSLGTALRNGFTLIAAVPPAVAVIPFTLFLNGDMLYSLIGTLGCYLGALFITPMIIWFLIGPGVDVQNLFITLIQIIILPLILSRVIQYAKLVERITPIKGTLTNWSFFIIVYTVIGLNRAVFVRQPISLLPSTIIVIVVTLVLGYVIERVGQCLHIEPMKITSLVLLGTYKNTGFARAPRFHQQYILSLCYLQL
jgi:BASS family bile acid:Na+ symporter